MHIPSLGGATEWLDTEPVGPAELRGRVVLPKQVTASYLGQLIDDIHQDWGDIATALGAAQPEDKAALLTALGVSVSYDPVARTARVTCTPRVREKSCRRGDTTVSLTSRSPPSSTSLADVADTMADEREALSEIGSILSAKLTLLRRPRRGCRPANDGQPGRNQ